MILEDSGAQIKCWKCSQLMPYRQRKCACGEILQGEVHAGQDCTNCYYSRANPFGNGDVICKKHGFDGAGIGKKCSDFVLITYD
jgi:hypothetical protein